VTTKYTEFKDMILNMKCNITLMKLNLTSYSPYSKWH